MSTIREYLTADHGHCDELFANMEDAVVKSIESAKDAYEEFAKEAEKHFQMEERIMFLEFEEKTGMTQGPTAIMRHEHAQMRNLIAEMGKALEAKDKDKFFGNSETLMILMQQHNMKEEQMLYPMAQQHLSAESDRIVEMMQSIIVE
ncbi:hemerythrin domain-containing protein [Sulfurimonas sp. CVO]|jgi:hemerythrin-like domain-containing protein|uniref:Hemerythrin domain-containing protein n=1 Tax=Sulfurimonas xiamenensis TaxID=2590021 RepID=A0AAJ4A2N2_9BACT|nr:MULTISPECIES: hemerythrin domain-containing protein [Sulfurimonas]PLY14661.1 MAG: hemerythrin HHE cation-binding protein [Sulfurimonas sp.]QFR42764.1 hemerythrin domain-containing protein [Sulfurimonas xiamenensis]QHG91646.1 hemerythrin domain-containing protein [Sulfurimonas sp. CVO]